MLQSLLVKDYMTGDALAFSPDMDVLDAIHQLLAHQLGGAPVVDDLGRVVGFLSEKDCLKIALNASYYEQRGGPVRQFMSRAPLTVDAEATLTEAAERFLEHPHRSFPVVSESRLVGQLTCTDVLKALEKLW